MPGASKTCASSKMTILYGPSNMSKWKSKYNITKENIRVSKRNKEA